MACRTPFTFINGVGPDQAPHYTVAVSANGFAPVRSPLVCRLDAIGTDAPTREDVTQVDSELAEDWTLED